MNKYFIQFLCFLLCTQVATKSHAQKLTQIVNNKQDRDLTITIESFDINDDTISLNYELRNNSNSDIWICDSISTYRNFELFMDDDGQTLILRKRLDVPCSVFWSVQPKGKYVRLRPGQKRVESLLLTVPVNSIHYYYGTLKQLQRSAVNATRFSIEIGYYVGNLPKIYLDTLKPPEKTSLDRINYSNIFNSEVLFFNRNNELLSQRDEEVLIPYTNQKFKGERVLRTTIDDVRIPYKETESPSKYNPPDLSNCTRIEILYEPSVLDFFYPHKSQRTLLSKEEMEYLGSEKIAITEDLKKINELENEIKQKNYRLAGICGIVSGTNKAHVSCFSNGRRVRSFAVYENSIV